MVNFVSSNGLPTNCEVTLTKTSPFPTENTFNYCWTKFSEVKIKYIRNMLKTTLGNINIWSFTAHEVTPNWKYSADEILATAALSLQLAPAPTWVLHLESQFPPHVIAPCLHAQIHYNLYLHWRPTRTHSATRISKRDPPCVAQSKYWGQK